MIVLEQKRAASVPGTGPGRDGTATNEGRIAFIEDATHPAVLGLKQRISSTWSPGEVVYRNAYLKPTRDARSIVQCHDKLAESALVEVPVGTGLLLLCQLRVGETSATNAVARAALAQLAGSCRRLTGSSTFRPVATVARGSSLDSPRHWSGSA